MLVILLYFAAFAVLAVHTLALVDCYFDHKSFSSLFLRTLSLSMAYTIILKNFLKFALNNMFFSSEQKEDSFNSLMVQSRAMLLEAIE